MEGYVVRLSSKTPRTSLAPVVTAGPHDRYIAILAATKAECLALAGTIAARGEQTILTDHLLSASEIERYGLEIGRPKILPADLVLSP